MKVSELVNLLQNDDYADFDVELVVTEPNKQGKGFPNVITYKVDDVADIGHSSKVVLLSGVLAKE